MYTNKIDINLNKTEKNKINKYIYARYFILESDKHEALTNKTNTDKM